MVLLPMYRWHGAGSSYQKVTDLRLGEGYWLLVLEDVNVTVTGTPIESLNLTLSPGWSLIGGIFSDVPVPGVFPGPYQLVTWNGAGYLPASVFEPGKGYWALVLETTQIQLTPT